jgi:hypothetical protein
MRASIISPAVLFFILAVTAVPAEPVYVVKDIRYLNFDKADNAEYVRFDSTAGWDRIEHWAKNRGVLALKDREPYTDNKASFVSGYGSELKLTNLNQNANYSLFIDFVCYSADPRLVSKLVISLNGRKLAALNFAQTPLDRPFELVIPRELYTDGTAQIHFDEFATTPGSWGIWDMILSTSGLPFERVVPKKTVPELKDPVQKAAEPEKKRTKKTVKPADKEKKVEVKGGETAPQEDAVPAVKPKEKNSTIIEPKAVHEPEIKDVEIKTPSAPKLPSGPEVNAPKDIRDIDVTGDKKKK